MASSMAVAASTVVGLAASPTRCALSSGFLKSPVSARNPLKLAKSSGGKFTCFERDWLRTDLSVIGFGLIGWVAPSSIPAINGNSLTGLFLSSVSTELAHFPTPPAVSSQFWSSETNSKPSTEVLGVTILKLASSGIHGKIHLALTGNLQSQQYVTRQIENGDILVEIHASWKDESLTETSIRVYAKFLRSSPRPNGVKRKLTAEEWMTIALAFKDVIGLAYNCWQLKNRLDSFKHAWSIWYQLLQGSTSLGCYLVKMTINMPEEWWTHKLKEIPKAKKF